MAAEPKFLYLPWLRQVLRAYLDAPSPPRLRGRPLALSPRQYGTALLMAYLGGLTLPRLARAAGVANADLETWRLEPDFLLVMDWSKSQFADYFEETLALEDFSGEEYFHLAGEFALLEESLRLRVRTRLYPRLRELGERLARQYQHGLPLDTGNFPLFRRLLLFFWNLEAFWPSPALARLQEKLLPLAREVVWPALKIEAEKELSPQENLDPEAGLHLAGFLTREIQALFEALPP